VDYKQILRDNGFRFNKRFGQNFLTDSGLLAEIAQDAQVEGKTILEIGAGAGTLTRELAKRAKKVIAFEIDYNLKNILDVTLAEFNNVEILIGDVMKYKTSEIENMCSEEYSIVANIPYYITTPLLMKFIEEGEKVSSLTLTVQKEVAERLAAKPSTKDYGAITVGVDAVGDVRITRILPRQLFYPQPNVDSAVVNVTVNRNKYDISNHALFRKTVKNSFAMRRKTLVNNLVNGFKIDRSLAERLLEKSGLSVGCRGEELSTEQFVKLYGEIQKNGNRLVKKFEVMHYD